MKMNNFFLDLVKNIKSKGYTEKEIIEKTGINQSTFWRIKNNKVVVNSKTIERLTKAFNIE